MIELTTTNLSIAVLAGMFVIIMVLFWHLGRESAAHSEKAKADEREAIIRLIQNTRRRSVGEEANEFRGVIVEKIKQR